MASLPAAAVARRPCCCVCCSLADRALRLPPKRAVATRQQQQQQQQQQLPQGRQRQQHPQHLQQGQQRQQQPLQQRLQRMFSQLHQQRQQRPTAPSVRLLPFTFFCGRSGNGGRTEGEQQQLQQPQHHQLQQPQQHQLQEPQQRHLHQPQQQQLQQPQQHQLQQPPQYQPQQSQQYQPQQSQHYQPQQCQQYRQLQQQRQPQQPQKQLPFLHFESRLLHNSHQATKLRRQLVQRDKHLDYLPSRRQRQQQAQAAAAAAAALASAAEGEEALPTAVAPAGRAAATAEGEERAEGSEAGREEAATAAERGGQALREADDLSEGRGLLRVEKEKFLHELLLEQHSLAMLFTEEQRAELLGTRAPATKQPEQQQHPTTAAAAGAAGSSNNYATAHDEEEGEAGEPPNSSSRVDRSSSSQAAATEQSSASKQQELEAVTSAALRTYRLLRPNALPFYKEDSLLSLQSRLNEATLKHSPMLQDMQRMQQQNAVPPSDLLPPDFDALQFNLPVINPAGFLLALAAAAESLAADVEKLCRLLQVPGLAKIPPFHPYRLKLLLDALWDSFKLRKSPLYAADWAERNWPRLQRILPPPLSSISAADVGRWLQQHLERVLVNQQKEKQKQQQQPSAFLSSAAASHLHSRRGGSGEEEEFYSLADDFLFDDPVISSDFFFERNTSFPVHKAGELFKKVADFLQLTNGPQPLVTDSAVQQFQNFVNALDKIGLSNWLLMNTKEIEGYLPEGDLQPVVTSEKDTEAARLLLKAAARGKANLLDFEELDPYKLLYGFETKAVEEELAQLPKNPFLSDAAVEQLFDVTAAAAGLRQKPPQPQDVSPALAAFKQKYGKTPLEAVVASEEKFLTTAGPAEWLRSSSSSCSSERERQGAAGGEEPAGRRGRGGEVAAAAAKGEEEEYIRWKWKVPLQSFFDLQRNAFVRERQGVDATLQLHTLRQTLLSVNRMMSMNKQGRVYYFRAIVAVGNGRGLFGLGINFGSSPKEARSNAALSALQQLQLLDIDTSHTLTTPVAGKEYSAEVKIIPRAMGKGLKSNLRYLPLLYLIGIDNCRVSFYGPHSSARWFTRAKALRRALQQLQSRRTIANATGQKYDLLLAPGEHWLHWPDRWFRPIVRDYEQMLQKIKEKRHRTYRRGFRSNISEVIPEECRPEFTPYTWKSPLQRWAEELKKKRLIAHNIYEKTIYVNPPRGSQSAAAEDGAAAAAQPAGEGLGYIDTHVVG